MQFNDNFEESLLIYLLFSRTRSIQYQTFPIAVLPEKMLDFSFHILISLLIVSMHQWREYGNNRNSSVT